MRIVNKTVVMFDHKQEFDAEDLREGIDCIGIWLENFSGRQDRMGCPNLERLDVQEISSAEKAKKRLEIFADYLETYDEN